MYSWQNLKESWSVTEILDQDGQSVEVVTAEVDGVAGEGTEVIGAYDESEELIYVNDQLLSEADVALKAVERELREKYGNGSITYDRQLSISSFLSDVENQSSCSNSVDLDRKMELYNSTV